jgi:hypothetical protein
MAGDQRYKPNTVNSAVTPPDAIDASWMTRFLRDLGYDAEVTAVDAQLIGTGQMAQNRRFNLTYGKWDGAAPRSFVGKFPSPEATSRRTGGLGAYLKEVSFYREIKPTVGIRTPIVHRIEFDPETSDFLLMMEDMAPASQGDQMAGCSLAEAEVAMEEIARLHAPRWGDPSLDDYGFLAGRRGASLDHQAYTMLWQGFLGRYRDILEPELIDLGRRLETRFGIYSRLYPGPRTVTHGDFRLDNTLLGEAGGRPTVTVVDWQTVGLGCGTLDVAYFIGAGLLPDVRRKHERDLLKRFHEALRAGGVRDYSENQLWHDYRWYAYAGYVMAVVATTLVVQTERGDEMFLTMARRHGLHATELESEKLLDEAAG